MFNDLAEGWDRLIGRRRRVSNLCACRRCRHRHGFGNGVAISTGVLLCAANAYLGIALRAAAISTNATMYSQNLFFAFACAAGIPVAAGVLYPICGLLLSPIAAAAA